jgi:four helix bundle protein
MAFMFEKLEVYRKALDFADQVLQATDGFSQGYSFLSNQLNRAAVSVSTNLAEGNGRFTKANRKNFFVVARGSAQECVPLIELAPRRGLIEDDTAGELRRSIEEIAKMTSGLINGLDRRQTA